jgi:hypothetical protein
VLELWERNEKVVVFCFYIETGRALRRHISAEMERRFNEIAAKALGLPKGDKKEVSHRLELVAEAFSDQKGLLREAADKAIGEILKPFDLSAADRETALDITLRFLRTRSFLLRHMDVGHPDRVKAFEDALGKEDASGLTLRKKIEAFGELLASRVPEERVELLDALRTIQTGARYAEAGILEDAETSGRRTELALPNVRLANGEVSRAARDRLMLAFNTPFFPEVLVASAVMAEGVDLHLNCRYVIHHDLAWNPSVLEQRTGRIDRLGCKSMQTEKPVVVYQPYIEATQDEKQFLVVRDRERWFQIVMGEPFSIDEAVTDRIADRILLPIEAAEMLSLHLGLRGHPVRRNSPTSRHGS